MFPCESSTCSAKLMYRKRKTYVQSSRFVKHNEPDFARIVCKFQLGSLFSDKFASPSGIAWPFFLAFPRFSSSSAFFALHSAGSAFSHGLTVRFCVTFARQIKISSSTARCALRGLQQPESHESNGGSRQDEPDRIDLETHQHGKRHERN